MKKDRRPILAFDQLAGGGELIRRIVTQPDIERLSLPNDLVERAEGFLQRRLRS